MIRPQLAAHGIHLVDWDELSEAQRSRGVERLRHGDLAGADAARASTRRIRSRSSRTSRRPGRSSSTIRSTASRCSSASRCRGSCRSGCACAPARSSPERVFVGLDQVIAANAEKLFPGMEIASASLFRVCRDAEVELDDDEGVSKRALVEREVQQRRFEPVVRLEVQPNADPADDRGARRSSSRSTPEDIYEMPALLDYTTLFEIAGLEIEALRDPPWTPLPPIGLEAAERRHLLRDPRRRHPAPPAVRQLLRERRAIHPRGRRRPADGLDQDDRLPGGRRHAVRAVADPRRRGGQAGRLRDRAQRPLRRGAQPPLVARAREGRRPRRVRRDGPQDAQQGRARRPQGGGRRALLRPHRHRQLPHPHGQALRGRRAADRRPGGHARRRHSVPLPHRPLAHAVVPDAARRADEHARAVRRADRARDREPRGRPAGADRLQDEPARGHGDLPAARREPRRRACRSTSSSAASAASPPASRA